MKTSNRGRVGVIIAISGLLAMLGCSSSPDPQPGDDEVTESSPEALEASYCGGAGWDRFAWCIGSELKVGCTKTDFYY